MQAPPLWVPGASGRRSTPGRGAVRRFRGPAWSSGSFFAIAVKRSRTFSDVLAEVSKKSKPASCAYASASAVGIARLSGFSVTRSSLLPARAMTIFSFAWRCSSLTHDLALSRDDCPSFPVISKAHRQKEERPRTYGLSDIIDNDGTVRIAIIHRSQRLISLLTSRIPNLELHSCAFVQRDGLCKEGSADRRFSVVVELVLRTCKRRHAGNNFEVIP